MRRMLQKEHLNASIPANGHEVTPMKKWIAIALTALILSGCSLKSIRKWFDEMEWERDDQIIKITDIWSR
jgi:hypothetical protein